MNKNISVLSRGNYRRSIISEALINSQLNGVTAYSSGIKPSRKVNPNAKKVLERHGEWHDKYHSKMLNTLNYLHFHLVISLCNQANESCPTFSNKTKVVHIGFKNPDSKDYSAFKETYQEIKKTLLPQIKKELTLS